MNSNVLNISEQQVWEALESVVDPEIPVLSLVEMRIIKEVKVEGDSVSVIITPTFSGCPALYQMKEDVERKLEELGFRNITVEVNQKEKWSTDLLSDETKEKLKTFGIAPPHRHKGNPLAVLKAEVECPYCNSTDTTNENPFGPTLCRMIYYCNSCQQPFERFKAL